MSCTTNVYYYAVTTTYIVIAIIVVVIPRTQFNVTNSNCYCYYYDDDCGVLIDSSMIIQPLEARRAAGKGMGQHGEGWADCQNRGGRYYVQRGGAAPRRAAGRRRARAAWRPGGSGHAGPILSSLPVPGRAGGQRRHLWALGLSARRRGGVLVAWLAAHSDHSAQMHSVRAAAQRNVCKLNETNLQQQTCLLQHTHTRARAPRGTSCVPNV